MGVSKFLGGQPVNNPLGGLSGNPLIEPARCEDPSVPSEVLPQAPRQGSSRFPFNTKGGQPKTSRAPTVDGRTSPRNDIRASHFLVFNRGILRIQGLGWCLSGFRPSACWPPLRKHRRPGTGAITSRLWQRYPEARGVGGKDAERTAVAFTQILKPPKMAVAQKHVPKWHLGKWKQTRQPAQPWLFNFEPHPNQTLIWSAQRKPIDFWFQQHGYQGLCAPCTPKKSPM